MGFRTVSEMVGRADMLEVDEEVRSAASLSIKAPATELLIELHAVNVLRKVQPMCTLPAVFPCFQAWWRPAHSPAAISSWPAP